MSSFCGANPTCSTVTSNTITDLNTLYTNPQGYAGIIAQVNTNVSRDSNGLISGNSLSTIITSLTPSGTNYNALADNIKSEYCHYYQRYYCAVQYLIADIANNPTSATASSYLGPAQRLNQHLSDITVVANTLGTNLLFDSTTNYSTTIAALKTKISENQPKLLEQNRIISSKTPITDLKKQMVKYSEEKGRYSDNLLKLYSVLNIVAIGLLIYIYKSAN